MRVAIAVDPPHDVRFADEAERRGHDVVAVVDGGPGLAAAIEQLRPDAAVVAANPRFLDYAVLSRCDALGVRVVASVTDDVERRYATGIGLHDLVDAEAGWRLVEEVLTGASGPGSADGADEAGLEHRGSVISVWGPSGSPGRTTVAIGIAAEIAAAGHSVVLGDVDTHSASIAPALGLMDEAPGFAAACRLAGADSLDRRELERIAQRHGTGDDAFWVLTGIGRASRWPELSAERVVATIDECRRWVDYVVLDTASSLENDEEISTDMFSPRRNAATLAALREADHVVAVASADPIGLSRFLRAHGDLADVAVTDSVTVVANKVRGSAIGLNPFGQVAQTLARFGGIEAPVLVGWDQAGCDAAVLSGRTLRETSPRSAARLAIEGLVTERLLPPRARPGRRHSVAGSRRWRR
jgi:MinD-like ATPase involved in chromosome partitioning or flagellar assembly